MFLPSCFFSGHVLRLLCEGTKLDSVVCEGTKLASVMPKRKLWIHGTLKDWTKLGGYIANLSDFYSYRLIGKLTDFLQLQEFSFRNQIVDSSTTAARLFLLCSNLGLETFSLRLQLYVLLLI